jgi:uncharacterized membrane protein
MIDLDTLGDPNSEARAVSADGSAVTGGLGFDNGYQAFRWKQDSGLMPLGTLDGGQSIGLGMNSDATIVVGAAYGTSNAFRWTQSEGMMSLGQLPQFQNFQARDVSDDGSIIVGISDSGGFIWTPGVGMRQPLDLLRNEYGLSRELTEWNSLSPFGMSPDGRYIVGYGTKGGWLFDRGVSQPVTPVPESATYGMFGAVGVLAVMAMRRHRIAVASL